MAITAQDVKKLRDLTNAGMMDCKKALTEANGDFDRARDILRERGQLVAAKRADREAKDGVAIAKISADGKHAAAIILNAETDFVAANDKFLTLANGILDLAVEANCHKEGRTDSTIYRRRTKMAHQVQDTWTAAGDTFNIIYI